MRTAKATKKCCLGSHIELIFDFHNAEIEYAKLCVQNMQDTSAIPESPPTTNNAKHVNGDVVETQIPAGFTEANMPEQTASPPALTKTSSSEWRSSTKIVHPRKRLTQNLDVSKLRDEISQRMSKEGNHRYFSPPMEWAAKAIAAALEGPGQISGEGSNSILKQVDSALAFIDKVNADIGRFEETFYQAKEDLILASAKKHGDMATNYKRALDTIESQEIEILTLMGRINGLKAEATDAAGAMNERLQYMTQKVADLEQEKDEKEEAINEAENAKVTIGMLEECIKDLEGKVTKLSTPPANSKKRSRA